MMRKFAVALAAASALSISTVANAAIIVTGSSNVDTPITVVNGSTQSTVDWGRNPEPSGSFNGSVDLFNDLAGLYSIIVSSSTPGAAITSLSISGISGTLGSYSASGSAPSLSLLVPSLAVGNYRVAFTGTAPSTGAVATGNLTFQVAPVPEPGTWAMMLVGFGAIGFAMRRRRVPVLAQLA
jgi:hypothetical protein